MTDPPRAILHLDLDAFFASVEAIEQPELVGKPVIVGGSREGRGVVASASYPARAFGVRSAMPTYRALRLCPQAIVVPPRHRLYREYSRRVIDLLRSAAPMVEQVSIDEAYMDLSTVVGEWLEAVDRARQIQRAVLEQIGLSASLGVAVNKLIAKVASDRDKPGGLTVVPPGTEEAFLAPLPVQVLWGIGPVTAQKLARLGVTTVADLASMSEAQLCASFGRQGRLMARQARGVDHRPLATHREAKSIGHERTFGHDIADAGALRREIEKLGQGVARRLKRAGLCTGTIALKLRYADFTTFTRQMTLSVPTDEESLIAQAALALLERSWTRGRPVRLLGLAAHNLSASAGQLALW